MLRTQEIISCFEYSDIVYKVKLRTYTDAAGGLFGGDSMGKAIKWLKDNDFEWAVLHE